MKTFEIKKIISPIDFSETSMKALDYAIDLSKVSGAEIILVHVIESLLSTTDPEYFSVVRSLEYENEISKGSKKHLKEIISGRNENGKMSMREVVITGRTYQEIVKLSNDENADLVVMGTHGVSGLREFVMGSNTYRVVRDADIPVLSIHPGSSHVGFKNILLPFNDQPHSREKVNFAIKIASLYNATLHVLGINFENDPEYDQKIKLEAKQITTIAEKSGVNCSVNVITEGYFAEPIINYAKTIDADLIVEMRGMERLSITDYFIEPMAEQLVNHSPIPVLSIKSTFNTDTVDLRFY